MNKVVAELKRNYIDDDQGEDSTPLCVSAIEMHASGFSISICLFLLDAAFFLALPERNLGVEWFMITTGAILASAALISAFQDSAILQNAESSRHRVNPSLGHLAAVVPILMWMTVFWRPASPVAAYLGFFLLGLAACVWILNGMINFRTSAFRLKQRGISILKTS